MLLGLSDAQTTGNTTTASLATTVKPAEQQSPSSSLADGSVPAAAAGAAIAAVVVGIAFIFIYRACYVNRKGRVVGAGMEAPAGEAFAQNPFSQLQTPASQPIVQGTVQITPQPRAPSLVDLSEDPRGEIRPASRTRSSDTADDYSSMDDSIAARVLLAPRPGSREQQSQGSEYNSANNSLGSWHKGIPGSSPNSLGPPSRTRSEGQTSPNASGPASVRNGDSGEGRDVLAPLRRVSAVRPRVGRRDERATFYPEKRFPEPPVFFPDALRQCVSLLGEGSYGRVYEVLLPATMFNECVPEESGKATRAVKQIALVDENTTRREFRGAALQASCKHRNILAVDFIFQDTFHLYLVMPKSRCTLERYIMAKERVAMPFLLEFSLDIARGMRYLHQDHRDGEPIAHRDLKTANILMMDSPDTEIPFCQLSDFGIARDASAYTGIVGTRLYMCPDGLKKKDYDPLKADVWSFGLVVMEMFTGLKPYGGTCSDDDIIAGRPFSSGQIDRLPDCLRNLVAACLSPSPVDRPSFARVVDHLEAAAKDVNAAINRNRPAENRSRYLTIDN